MRARPVLAPIAVLGLVALTGCAVEHAMIRSEALSYDDIIEDTTDKLLLLNILRAKDKAPLHFDEIPSLHESLQATASVQATWPFGATDTGPVNKPTTRNTVTPSIMVQATPTFEIDHLDTQDFVTGIASPIDEKFVKYWLDRGLDKRLVLLLFFSAADITYTETQNGQQVRYTLRVRNAPREAISTLPDQLASTGADANTDEDERCKAHSEFQHYLKLIDSLTSFSAHTYSERRVLAKDVPIDRDAVKALASLAALDTTKFQWSVSADKQLTIAALSSEPKTAFCLAGHPVAAGENQSKEKSVCTKAVVETTAGAPSQTESDEPPIGWPLGNKETIDKDTRANYCTRLNGFIKKPDDMQLRLEIRSVGEIIQFLGDLLQYQEELKSFQTGHADVRLELHDPVTFGYCKDAAARSANPACDDVFFNLRRDTCNTRFSLNYRGTRYAVSNYNIPNGESCPSGDGTSSSVRDHTLEVLAIVHQLVDLQKSAKDIRETPYVQVLP
jgi:hypothetical protein